MLGSHDAAAVADQFGVSDEQVRRDHLLSHLLGVLADRLPDKLVFFGGTALARTHLPEGRLSEDLDLASVPRRVDVVAEVERALAEGVRREFGPLLWSPRLSAVRDVEPAVLRAPDGLTVRVQLLDPVGLPAWPTERRPLLQRYADAPPATLQVPTLAGFAAAKTSAWHDRHAARDLYDLWGLARVGALDAAAGQLFARLGPTGHPPRSWMFHRAPTPAQWTLQLGGQTRLQVGPGEALDVVREAWAQAVDGGEGGS